MYLSTQSTLAYSTAAKFSTQRGRKPSKGLVSQLIVSVRYAAVILDSAHRNVSEQNRIQERTIAFPPAQWLQSIKKGVFNILILQICQL
jgi:hypothetical protein